MDWNSRKDTIDSAQLADLDNPVGKAGSTESVAIIAFLWGIAIIAVP